MSNTDTDSFIKEVSEEVRQDRMFKLWKRYAPFVIGAIVIVVGGSAAWNWMKHREVMAAREKGAAFVEAGDSAGQIEILASTLDGDAGTLAELRLAAALAQGEERAAAAEIYRKIANGSERAAYRDLALLRAIQIDAARGDPAALVGELGPLVTEGRPYRPLALELRGVLRVNAGNLDGARADLEAVLTDEAATLDTRRRVGEILSALSPGALAPGRSGAASPDTEETTEEKATEPDASADGLGPAETVEEEAPAAGAAAVESGSDSVGSGTSAVEESADQDAAGPADGTDETEAASEVPQTTGSDG